MSNSVRFYPGRFLAALVKTTVLGALVVLTPCLFGYRYTSDLLAYLPVFLIVDVGMSYVWYVDTLPPS